MRGGPLGGVAGQATSHTDKNEPAAVVAEISVTIAGHVRSLQGDEPVPSVDVIFEKKGAEWTATSDNEGAYSLVLSPGSYQVRAFGDRVMAIGLPALVVGEEGATYDVHVAPHSVVRGVVRFANGRPAKGALVIPHLQDTRSAMAARGELGSAEVDEDGHFELFTRAGNLVLEAEDGRASGRVLVPALKQGEEREEIAIIMVANGSLQGVVQDPDGVVIEGATVLVSVQVPGSGEYDRVPITSDARGRFQFALPRPAHTIIEASASGFAQAPPQSFMVEPGESRKGLTLVVVPAVHILEGRVVDSEGEPLAYAEVALGQEGSKARYKRAYTTSKGLFEFDSLGPGPHRLRVRKTGYEQTRLRDVMAPRSDLQITMPASD